MGCGLSLPYQSSPTTTNSTCHHFSTRHQICQKHNYAKLKSTLWDGSCCPSNQKISILFDIVDNFPIYVQNFPLIWNEMMTMKHQQFSIEGSHWHVVQFHSVWHNFNSTAEAGGYQQGPAIWLISPNPSFTFLRLTSTFLRIFTISNNFRPQ